MDFGVLLWPKIDGTSR